MKYILPFLCLLLMQSVTANSRISHSIIKSRIDWICADTTISADTIIPSYYGTELGCLPNHCRDTTDFLDVFTVRFESAQSFFHLHFDDVELNTTCVDSIPSLESADTLEIGFYISGPFYPCTNLCKALANEPLNEAYVFYPIFWKKNLKIPVTESFDWILPSFDVNSDEIVFPDGIQFPCAFAITVFHPSLNPPPNYYYFDEQTSSYEPLNHPYCPVFEFEFTGTGLLCDWPASDAELISPYSYCENAINLFEGENKNLQIETLNDQSNALWLSAISPSSGIVELEIVNLIQNVSDCRLEEMQIETFGPFSSCEFLSICNLIEMSDDYLFSTDSISIANGLIVGSASIEFDETVEASKWLIKVTYKSSCSPCNLRLKYDLENAINSVVEEMPVNEDCLTCLPTEKLTSETKYVLSCWVKQEEADPWIRKYTSPAVSIAFNGSETVIGPYSPDDVVQELYVGPIIDEWQLMEIEFTTPSDVSDFTLILESQSSPCYFDDIRIFPSKGSMKSYVYDPTNLRLVAELDERHYTTFYEYDEEGRLLRLKKETEKGIMTIQETRSSVIKRD